MKYKLTILLLTVFVFVGCGRHGAPDKSEVSETYVADANSIGFDIAPAPNGSSSAWIGTYSSGGKIARFRFEFGSAQTVDHPMKNVVVSSGNGRFIAVDGSDSSELLSDLKKALEAKNLPTKVQRAKELPFTFASFGDHESQASQGGGFSPQPPGNWTVIKIFIGEGEHECEFFLNFNPVIKKGQFSEKDPDYGDEVLAQLAKVL